MKRLIELFDPINGLPVKDVSLLKSSDENSIRYLRPSKTYKGTIKAYINKLNVNKNLVFPKDTIFVSTNGQGSHTYAYVSTFDFVPNSDVVVLIPREEMPIEYKIFYSFCITKNRYKYSYGRKPKCDRLFELLLPSKEEMPNWLGDIASQREIIEHQICKDFLENDEFLIETGNNIKENLILISDLFTTINGISSANVKRYAKKDGDNFIPFIRPSKNQSTSRDGYVNTDEVDDNMIFPKGTLYVSTDGQGSHTYAYVSISSFVPNSNTTVLLPKREMSTHEKLFYAFAITKNRYKFSYGRKPKGNRLLNIKIPKKPPNYINEAIFNTQ
jgi:hypothetical protein